MRSGWQSRREGPATQRNEALFESFLQRRDLWPPGGTQPILISDFTTPSVPFRIQRAPCCVVLHLLSLRWSLRSSAHPRSPRHKKTTDFNFRGRHITVPLHIPRTPFSLALTALFVSDSKGVLLCCVASLFPPFLFGREGTQRWTGSSRPNARRSLFEPLTTSPDTWTTGGSAERSMGAAFGLRALTHLSRPPQAIWGFVMLGFAVVCIRQVRN